MFTFAGGAIGPWCIVRVEPIIGEPLAHADRLSIVNGLMTSLPEGTRWSLHGVTSNERYVTQQEREQLAAKQPALGRPEAIYAALIPVRKTAAWWSLAQDERRRILAERSGHITTGLKYLPAIARRLHHCRDLGGTEPFDFLTWFEYAPTNAAAFDELVAELRTSEEWTYVDREVDIRVLREPA